MGPLNRKSLSALLIIIIVGGLAGTAHFTEAQTGTNVSSQIITQDTTWTKADSPYTLMGPVDVAAGVTLTIDAGVTVNGSSWINVNGILEAQGSSTDNVIFTIGYIVVGNNASSACKIEDSILSGTSIQSSGGSVTANNCVFNGGGGIDASAGSAIITNNYISGGVTVADSSNISDNSILGGIYTGSASGVLISENNVTNPKGRVMDLYGTGKVSDNIISGGSVGIAIEALSHWTIEGNLITNNQIAMSISTSFNSLLPPVSDSSIIENNTIANNGEGIAGLSQETIIFNNFENNGPYNLENGGSSAINATYNWWGTTDASAINQTIFDNKNNYNLGVVTFVPFLNAPNPEAPAITTPTPALTIATPASTSSPSTSSSQSPSHSSPASTSSPATSQPQFNGLEIAIFATLIVIVALLSVIIALLLRRKPQKNSALS
jgi:hypothetical protein